MSAAALARSSASKSAKQRCRVAIAEANELLSEGIAAILAREKKLTICGLAKNRKDTLTLMEREEPDVLLLSFSLNGCDPIALVKDIAARFSATRILVTGVTNEELYAGRLIHAGAAAWLSAHATTEEFLKTIRAITAGGCSPVPAPTKSNKPSPLSLLTDRELHVFRLIGRGVGTGDIALELGLSRKTIEYYREEIKRKLGYRDTAELHRGAFEWAQRRP